MDNRCYGRGQVDFETKQVAQLRVVARAHGSVNPVPLSSSKAPVGHGLARPWPSPVHEAGAMRREPWAMTPEQCSMKHEA